MLGNECAILIQNAFPTLEKYIDHIHVVDGKPVKVIDSICDEILENFKYLLKLKRKELIFLFRHWQDQTTNGRRIRKKPEGQLICSTGFLRD